MGAFLSVLLAVVVAAVIIKIGMAMLGALARPVPEAPPPGELRRVRLRYRCGVCGLELRIEQAETEDPEPPRHCMQEMDIVAPIE